MSHSDLHALGDVEEREAKRLPLEQIHHLRDLGKIILRHPGPLSLGLLMVFLAAVATLLEPRIFGYAIDEGILPKDWGRLRQISTLFFVVVCARAVGTILQGYCFELLGQRVTQDLRCQLFSHMQRLPMQMFDKNPAGRLLTRVTNDVASLSEMFSAGFLSMISNLLIVAGILGWLLYLNLRLGLIACSVFPVLMVLTVLFSSWLKKSYREARSRLSALNTFLAENLMGMKVIHLFNRQNTQQEKFDRINGWYTEAQIATVRVFAFFQPSITWAAGLSMTLIIWLGGIEAARGEIKLGVLVAYFAYVLSLFQPMREIADKWNVFLSGMASAERIFSILKWETELDESSLLAHSRQHALGRGHIVFENVWFAYDREHWVLKNLSFEIGPGQKVGVVGHTGAGKTTLISLLLRFYEPQRGRITIDGCDIQKIEKQELRSMFGMVQQDVFTFAGSYRDNITLWEDSIANTNEKELDGILKTLGCTEWWVGERKDEKIQERGSNLSLGEKQVLAFARALAKKPKIWILDEATANMDSQAEMVLGELLNRYSDKKTLVMIAHRISTVKQADLILVLHHGQLVQSGKHEELLALGGIYSKIVQFQLGESLKNPNVSL